MRLYKQLFDYSNPNSLGSRLRRRRARLLSDILTMTRERAGRPITVVDLGGTETYWRIIPRPVLERSVERICLVNLQPSEIRDGSLFSVKVADACDLHCFADNSFDMVHSNSAIEHVGDWERTVRFAREAKRLAPAHFIQTPYFWFPFEPHFGLPVYHWLPEQIRVGIALRYTLGHLGQPCQSVDEATHYVQHARLLDRRQFSTLFPDSHIAREKLGFATKSLIAIKTPP